MLTNDINKVEEANSIAKKFASVVYNEMMTKKYGVKPCKTCGDEDKIGDFNIHVLKYEMHQLKSISLCDEQCSCVEQHKCKPNPIYDEPACGCDFDLINFDDIKKMIDGK